MSIREIQSKSLLRKHGKIDSWFVSRYGMNLYRGCTHDCVYCDGRSQRYYVEGDFGRDVAVKVNAPELLKKELNPQGKRIPLKPGYILLGGGVGDAYQPVEKSYRLTRRILELLDFFGFPVHILTKSTLVKRDLDLIKRINEQTRAIVSFSLSSADENLGQLFEPGVPGPGERIDAAAFFKQQGIASGIFLMPIIPFLTDAPKQIEKVFKKAKQAEIDFVVFGGMTLKEGRQKDHFFSFLECKFPGLGKRFDDIYRNNVWGESSGGYSRRLDYLVYRIAKQYQVPVRIPPVLYRDILDENDRVIVILEHLDYIKRLEGQPSPFGKAAYSISRLKEPISNRISELKHLKWIGPATESIIREIIARGTSLDLEKLMGI